MSGYPKKTYIKGSKAKICYDYKYKEKDYKTGIKNNYVASTGPSSEADQDSELTGFKVVYNGTMLLNSKWSDSESRPIRGHENRCEEYYASAKEFAQPSTSMISFPSFA